MPGVRMPGSTSSPRSISATPLQRWAAAGAKMSRPANVAPAACSWYSGFVSSTARSAPPAIATAGASSPLSGPITTPAPPATSIATARRSVPTPGIDDREHDARRHVPDAAGERERSGANVERRDLVGEIDDADVRRDVADHRTSRRRRTRRGCRSRSGTTRCRSDATVAPFVTAFRRSSPRGTSVARVIERHATGRAKTVPGRDEGRCQPPDGTSPVGASGGKTTGASQRASL